RPLPRAAAGLQRRHAWILEQASLAKRGERRPRCKAATRAAPEAYASYVEGTTEEPTKQMGAYRRALVPEVGAWVHRLPLHLDLVMKVRPRGATGIAGVGDHLTAFDLLLGGHVHAGQMTVQRLDIVAVIDDQADAVLGLRSREHHGARRRRHHRGPPRRADVHPAVGLERIVRPGRVPPPELRVHGPADGPARRQRPQHPAGLLD